HRRPCATTARRTTPRRRRRTALRACATIADNLRAGVDTKHARSRQASRASCEASVVRQRSRRARSVGQSATQARAAFAVFAAIKQSVWSELFADTHLLMHMSAPFS